MKKIEQNEGATKAKEIPDYETALKFFHAGFKSELRWVVQSLPMHSRMHVADVGCGDGFFCQLLAERLEGEGTLTGFDVNAAYLEKARKYAGDWKSEVKTFWVETDVASLEKNKTEFDLVWCAQSLFSFPEPVEALRQMAAIVKTGGTLAVLENDTMHQMRLPWPVETELQIRLAEYRALCAASAHPQKYYVGRRLPQLFADAGLETLSFRTQAIDRLPPFSKEVDKFVDKYLEELYARIAPYVKSSFLEETQEAMSLLRRSPQFNLCWTNVLIRGRPSSQ